MMITKLTAVVTLVACLLSFGAHDALAFYNPSTGRWLSRDPIGERGFNATVVNVVRNRESAKTKELLPYTFLANDPIQHVDALGLSCVDPCKWARSHQEGETGRTVCCGGKKYACVIFSGGQTAAGNPTARAIIYACIMEHEKVHVKDPNYICPKQCIWKHPTGGDWASPSATNLRAGECAAYKVGVACLERARSQCRGNPDCEAEIDAEIATQQIGIDKNCD